MKKKLLALLLVCCMVLSMIPAVSAAVMESGTCGENITWGYDPTLEELVISGSGEMVKPEDGYPWAHLYAHIKTLVFEEGVTHIGDAAFVNFYYITELRFPDSLTHIGENAFADCPELREVHIPRNVTFIGDYAFRDCEKLTDVTMLSAGKELKRTFENCTALDTIVIPEGVEVLNATFALCEDLVSVTLPDSIRVLDGAFAGCVELSYVELPEGLERIDGGCFGRNFEMEYLVIPSTVTYIGRSVFAGGYIDPMNYAQLDTSVDYVYFLGDAPEFADNAFAEDHQVTTITLYYPQDNATWTDEVRQAYGGDPTWIAYDPATAPGAPEEEAPEIPEIPDEIVTGECGNNAFWSLNRTTGLLTVSGEGPMYEHEYGGAPWITYREEIHTIVIEEGITTIGAQAFEGCDIDSVSFPSTLTHIGNWAFLGSTITQVDLPGSLTYIGDQAFENTQLTELILPEGIHQIGTKAFYNCHKLTRIVLPESLKFLNPEAFAFCDYLTDITVLSTSLDPSPGVFRVCVRLKDISGFRGSYLSASMFESTGIEKLVIPNTVTWIEDMAFSDCQSMTEVLVPASVEHLGSYAFGGCDYLKKVVFEGDAPENNGEIINGKSDVICYYPSGNKTWTQEVREQLAPNATWLAHTPGKPLPVNNPFKDVKSSDYFYEPVLWAVENGITSGVSANRFAPNNSCTRAQVVTFLWRAAGKPEPSSGNNPFRDVKVSDYFYKAVLWAVEKGITAGTSANTFSPNSPCTRGQVVAFLYRSAGTPAPASGKNPFSDVKTTDYYYDAVLWAVEEGITAGISATRFGPGNTCTRAQVVSFLYRKFTK